MHFEILAEKKNQLCQYLKKCSYFFLPTKTRWIESTLQKNLKNRFESIQTFREREYFRKIAFFYVRVAV